MQEISKFHDDYGQVRATEEFQVKDVGKKLANKNKEYYERIKGTKGRLMDHVAPKPGQVGQGPADSEPEEPPAGFDAESAGVVSRMVARIVANVVAAAGMAPGDGRSGSAKVHRKPSAKAPLGTGSPTRPRSQALSQSQRFSRQGSASPEGRHSSFSSSGAASGKQRAPVGSHRRSTSRQEKVPVVFVDPAVQAAALSNYASGGRLSSMSHTGRFSSLSLQSQTPVPGFTTPQSHGNESLRHQFLNGGGYRANGNGAAMQGADDRNRNSRAFAKGMFSTPTIVEYGDAADIPQVGPTADRLMGPTPDGMYLDCEISDDDLLNEHSPLLGVGYPSYGRSRSRQFGRTSSSLLMPINFRLSTTTPDEILHAAHSLLGGRRSSLMNPSAMLSLGTEQQNPEMYEALASVDATSSVLKGSKSNQLPHAGNGQPLQPLSSAYEQLTSRRYDSPQGSYSSLPSLQSPTNRQKTDTKMATATVASWLQNGLTSSSILYPVAGQGGKQQQQQAAAAHASAAHHMPGNGHAQSMPNGHGTKLARGPAAVPLQGQYPAMRASSPAIMSHVASPSRYGPVIGKPASKTAEPRFTGRASSVVQATTVGPHRSSPSPVLRTGGGSIPGSHIASLQVKTLHQQSSEGGFGGLVPSSSTQRRGSQGGAVPSRSPATSGGGAADHTSSQNAGPPKRSSKRNGKHPGASMMFGMPPSYPPQSPSLNGLLPKIASGSSRRNGGNDRNSPALHAHDFDNDLAMARESVYKEVLGSIPADRDFMLKSAAHQLSLQRGDHRSPSPAPPPPAAVLAQCLTSASAVSSKGREHTAMRGTPTRVY